MRSSPLPINLIVIEFSRKFHDNWSIQDPLGRLPFRKIWWLYLRKFFDRKTFGMRVNQLLSSWRGLVDYRNNYTFPRLERFARVSDPVFKTRSLCIYWRRHAVN